MADKLQEFVKKLSEVKTVPELRAVADEAKKTGVTLHPSLLAQAMDRIVDKK
jgi:hypothetical protein